MPSSAGATSMNVVTLSVILGFLALMGSASGPSAGGTRTVDQPRTDEVTLNVTSWDDVQQLAARHRGKVVVIDIWTTTCLTCVEEFPKFVELQRKYGKDKLACISVNCDNDGIETKPPHWYRDDVLKFLQHNQATFENVMLDLSLLDFMELIGLNSTPAILIYGRDGKLARRFDNDISTSADEGFTIQQVAAVIDRSLAGR